MTVPCHRRPCSAASARPRALQALRLFKIASELGKTSASAVFLSSKRNPPPLLVAWTLKSSICPGVPTISLPGPLVRPHACAPQGFAGSGAFHPGFCSRPAFFSRTRLQQSDSSRGNPVNAEGKTARIHGPGVIGKSSNHHSKKHGVSAYLQRMLTSMAVAEHTTKAFDNDLQELGRMIAEMGGLAERQIVEVIEALTKRDLERAGRVVQADAAIDSLQRNIEERVIVTIARRQPMAIDLREVVGVLRISNELERIGDLAKNIGKRVIALHGGDISRRSLRGVRHMASLALVQLRDALDSFARRDLVQAGAVRVRDEEVDRMDSSMFQELLTYMFEDPGTIAASIHLVFCTKNIERMGDHATNIADAVQYIVEGSALPDALPPSSDVHRHPLAMGA